MAGRRWQVLAAFLMVMSISATVVQAQKSQVVSSGGFQPNRDYLSLQPWESIDTASGNVILTFTDLELPGNNGRTLTFQRTFNNIHGGSTAPSRWVFAISGLPMRVTITPDIRKNQVVVGSQPVDEATFTPKFSMPDGTTSFQSRTPFASRSRLPRASPTHTSSGSFTVTSNRKTFC